MKKIIQISSGRGPEECNYVVAKVLKIFLKELVPELIEYTILNKIDGYENGAIQSVAIQIEGSNLDSFLENWIGTILWIGQSVYRKYNKRKNWYISISELINIQNVEINENKFSYQTMRSSGAGGQHVNKVSSGVRAIYEPLGISVTVTDTRSQHQNKRIATKRLIAKILIQEMKNLSESVKNEWQNHLNIERGNPVRIFKGSDFKKNKKNKSYKKRRNELKNNLRKEYR